MRADSLAQPTPDAANKRRRWRAPRASELSLVLTSAAALVGTASLAAAARADVLSSVVDSFPPLFFFALGALTLAAILLWLFAEQNSLLDLLQWLLLNAALWLGPLHFGNWLPGGFHAYDFFGFTEFIIRTGHTAPQLEQLWYHNWPGFFIGVATLMNVSGIAEPDALIRLAPFFVQLAYLPGLYVFFRHTLGRYRWAALWLFSLGNWEQHNALLPQAYALVLFYVLLALFTKPIVWHVAGGAHGRYRLVAVLLIAAITISHVLTATVAVTMLLALWLLRSYRIRSFVLLSIVTAAAWTVYGGASYFEGTLRDYVALLGRLTQRLISGFLEVVVQPASAGSEAHQTVVAVRLLLMLVIVAIGVVGLGVSLRSRTNRSMDLTVASIGVAAASIMALTGIFSGGVISRVYAFVLPVGAYFGTKAFQARTGLLAAVVVLFVALPLRVAAQEGNQVIDYIPQGYVDGLRFFHEHAVGGSVVEPRALEGDPPPFGGFTDRDNYFQVRYRWPNWEGVLTAIATGRMGTPPAYVITSPLLDEAVTAYLTGDTTIADRIDAALGRSRASRLYNNGVVTINLLGR